MGPFSVLSQAVCPVSLSVTLVYCGQTVGWIKMPFGMEVGLGRGDIVFDGDLAPLPQKGHSSPPPSFQPMSVVAKWSPISPTAKLLFMFILWYSIFRFTDASLVHCVSFSFFGTELSAWLWRTSKDLVFLWRETLTFYSVNQSDLQLVYHCHHQPLSGRFSGEPGLASSPQSFFYQLFQRETLGINGTGFCGP